MCAALSTDNSSIYVTLCLQEQPRPAVLHNKYALEGEEGGAARVSGGGGGGGDIG